MKRQETLLGIDYKQVRFEADNLAAGEWKVADIQKVSPFRQDGEKRVADYIVTLTKDG